MTPLTYLAASDREHLADTLEGLRTSAISFEAASRDFDGRVDPASDCDMTRRYWARNSQLAGDLAKRLRDAEAVAAELMLS